VVALLEVHGASNLVRDGLLALVAQSDEHGHTV
jgi:hypothetical protein